MASSIDSNVQKQWMTRTWKPLPRNGPSALAPRAVLRKVAPQPGHVIATVIVQNEKAAARPGDALGLVHLGGAAARKLVHIPIDDVHRAASGAEPRWSAVRRDVDPCAEVGQLPFPKPPGRSDQKDVAATDRPERFEGARDLPLDVQAPGEALVERASKVDRKISHRTASMPDMAGTTAVQRHRDTSAVMLTTGITPTPRLLRRSS